MARRDSAYGRGTAGLNMHAPQDSGARCGTEGLDLPARGAQAMRPGPRGTTSQPGGTQYVVAAGITRLPGGTQPMDARTQVSPAGLA